MAALLGLGEARAQPAPANVETSTPAAAAAPEPCAPGPLSPLLSSIYSGSRDEFTAEADYVLWFLAGHRGTSPIVTSLPGQQPFAQLGDPNRDSVLASGGRFALGYWLIEDNPWVPQGIKDVGVEGRFFFVGRRSADLVVDDLNNSPTLFRPFFDLNNHVESGFLVAAPGIASGSVTGHAQADMWGAEANVWKNVFFDRPGTSLIIDLMAGFRYLNLNSALDISSISSFSQTIPAGSAFASFAGNQLFVQDSFTTHNNFYGGQVGITAKGLLLENLLTIEGSARIALGTNSEDVNISGSQLRTSATGTTFSNGGVLALASNIGNHHMNKFAQVPELGLKLSVPIGNHLRLMTGFSALYWTRIVRAEGQIDRTIDVTQIPNNALAAGTAPTGLARPGVPFTQSDLWLLGINFGVEYRW
jgi:hypothetical protein